MATDPKLTPEGILVLTSLAARPRHGYAIQQDIAQMSGRHLGPGSLYGSIARLEAAGYIEPLEDEGPRRPYRLTPSGAKALTLEAESLRRIAMTATRRLATR